MSTGLCRACLVFFNDTATTEIYTLSLHDALPILQQGIARFCRDREDIIRAFPDHELILSLGCESAVNVPVRWDGRTLGALNLLHEAGYYGEAQLPALSVFAALAVAPILRILGERG